ncbi:hypothetical protein M405DRAFT_878612 [Rhizopogon salebrosus TDB-379]|nr:hypothetical protein M405DRAFT_878612 [Rhizopogon salebrosus TDB-379]
MEDRDHVHEVSDALGIRPSITLYAWSVWTQLVLTSREPHITAMWSKTLDGSLDEFDSSDLFTAAEDHTPAAMMDQELENHMKTPRATSGESVINLQTRHKEELPSGPKLIGNAVTIRNDGEPDAHFSMRHFRLAGNPRSIFLVVHVPATDNYQAFMDNVCINITERSTQHLLDSEKETVDMGILMSAKYLL